MLWRPRLTVGFLLLGWLLGALPPPALSAADSAADLKAQVAKLRGEIELLKAENETLKKENQALRRLLSTPEGGSKAPGAGSAPGTAPDGRPGVAQPPVSPPARGWVLSSSGVRHNSSCRHYTSPKGRPCGPTDGRPCRLCGG